ncbi:MAG: DUF882 domain-containing protein [Deltaproteobacteria bacterium]|nr:DUF882 domain-containing protein [Deltaproteobacteria bacterium]
MDRRSFLTAGLLAGCSLAFPLKSWARNALVPDFFAEKVLSLYNVNTGESLEKIPFWENGVYLPQQIEIINHFCRDFRNDSVREIDIRLLDMLFDIRQILNRPQANIHLISAYRSPETNESLRKKGHGVAKQSFHLVGKAFDIRVEGVELVNLRDAAWRYHQGGVGYYPRSRFVHIDTGPVRSW